MPLLYWNPNQSASHPQQLNTNATMAYRQNPWSWVFILGLNCLWKELLIGLITLNPELILTFLEKLPSLMLQVSQVCRHRRRPIWSPSIHSITVSTEDFFGAVRSKALFSKCILRGRYSDHQQGYCNLILGIRDDLFRIVYIFQCFLCNYNIQTNKVNNRIMVIISDQYWKGSLIWWLKASWLSQLPLLNLELIV